MFLWNVFIERGEIVRMFYVILCCVGFIYNCLYSNKDSVSYIDTTHSDQHSPKYQTTKSVDFIILLVAQHLEELLSFSDITAVEEWLEWRICWENILNYTPVLGNSIVSPKKNWDLLHFWIYNRINILKKIERIVDTCMTLKAITLK